MFDITADDTIKVYEQLKGRYELVLTSASELDEGFAADCPVIVGKSHGQILELYEYGGEFIMDVMDSKQACGTHWHPSDVERAVEDIAEFMEGKSDYQLSPFGKA